MRWFRRSIALIALLLVAWWAVAPRGSGAPPNPLASIDPAVFVDAARDPLDPATVMGKADPAAGAGTRPPNLILIMADDLGYGDLGAYGGPFPTPHLDGLAASGVRFTAFYSSAPVCSPARAALLTGRYPVRTGITYVIFASHASFATRMRLALSKFGVRLGTSDYHDSFVAGLPPSEITLAEALRVGGYVTGLVGKWHLGDFMDDRQYAPTRHGFDVFEGIPHSNDEFPVAYWRGEHELKDNLGLDQEQVTRDLTQAAVGFIEANADRPFFLYFAEKNVHIPLCPGKPFAGTTPSTYGDSVVELDWSVGQLLEALDRTRLRDDTLVVFLSDNGPWFQGSTHGLRGRKGMPFEGGQRVPFIAAWPGRIAAGRVVDAPAMGIDVLPTFLAVAGLTLPRDRVIDGRNLWPAMTSAAAPPPHDELLFFHDKQIDGLRAGASKYYPRTNRFYWPVPLDAPGSIAGDQVRAYTYTDPTTGRTVNLQEAGPMLYDLGHDPAEAYNLADRRPDDVARLDAIIAPLGSRPDGESARLEVAARAASPSVATGRETP